MNLKLVKLFIAAILIVSISSVNIRHQKQLNFFEEKMSFKNLCACNTQQPTFLGISQKAKNIRQMGPLPAQEFNNKIYSNKKSQIYLEILQNSVNSAETMFVQLQSESTLLQIKNSVFNKKTAKLNHYLQEQEFLQFYQQDSDQDSDISSSWTPQDSNTETTSSEQLQYNKQYEGLTESDNHPGTNYQYWEIDNTSYYLYIGVWRDHDPDTGFFAWTTTECVQSFERDGEIYTIDVPNNGEKQLVWQTGEVESVIESAKYYGYYVYDYTKKISYFVPGNFSSEDQNANWSNWYWVFDALLGEKPDQHISLTQDEFSQKVKELGYQYSDLEIKYVFNVIDEDNDQLVQSFELVRQKIRIDFDEIYQEILGDCVGDFN